MVTLSNLERETIINFNASDKTANIYTVDPVWMRKLEKLGGEKKGLGVEINIPKSWIKIQKPRTLSAGQLAAAKANLAKAHRARAKA